MYTRAEWILRDAADILRGGVGDVGRDHAVDENRASGRVVWHGDGGTRRWGGGNLHVLGAMGIPGEFYERGLLHPFIDYDEVEPWLHSKIDAMDDEGYVHFAAGSGARLRHQFRLHRRKHC